MTRILVAGGIGLLGSEIARVGIATGQEIYALSREELDITDRTSVRETLDRIDPEILINCARRWRPTRPTIRRATIWRWRF